MADVLEDPDNLLPALRIEYDRVRHIRGIKPTTDEHWAGRLRMLKGLGVSDSVAIESMFVTLKAYPDLPSSSEQT